MPINTIDGFYIGSSTPIDTRITAADAAERTSIVYKYDGLKVLQLDTRENWVWNAANLAWEMDSNSIDISGPANNLAKYNTGTGLTYSNLYNLPDKVGIRTATPNSVFQINGQSGDNFNVYLDSTNGVIMSTNWFYHFDASTNVYTSSNPSVQLKLTTQGGVQVRSREANANTGTFTKHFEIHDPNGFNYLKAPSGGNFISGSVSIGTGTSPYATQQLFYTDGPARFNSGLHKSVSFVYWNGSNFTRYRGFASNGTIPSATNIGSSYTVGSQENEIIMNSSVASMFNINLPTLSGSAHDLGRELFITLEGNDDAIMTISSATDILDMNGDNSNPFIYKTESVRFISVNTVAGVKWKLVDYTGKLNSYPETWKFIGNAGTMMNGQPIPDFNASNDVENSGISNTQNMRLRKIDEKHVHLQGTMKVNNVNVVPGNSNEYEINILRLPTGYRSIQGQIYDGFLHDDDREIYHNGQFKLSQSGIIRFYFYEPPVSITTGDSYLSFDHIIPID